MDYRLAGLEPARVFHFFEEICRIPHGSGNTKGVSDYCREQAERMGLECVQDEWNNIIIKKPASPGYENGPTVMLQGHLDMVAEKLGTSSHDFLKDPLDLFVEDGWIGARDTTLGGDDGIAVAMALAILEDDTLAHPALECVFTTEEEVGMDGARGLDMSGCRSRYLINLDSEEEGFLLASCAGGLRADLTLPVRRTEVTGQAYRLEISGLFGGHSGGDINKERASANILMGRLLFALDQKLPFAVRELAGGSKDNAITREAFAVIFADGSQGGDVKKTAEDVLAVWKAEYANTDPGVELTVTDLGEQTGTAISPVDQQKMIFLLMDAPYGIQHMSTDMEGLVETSLNLGIMELKEDAFTARFSIRSNVATRKQLVSDKLKYLIEFLGGSYHTDGDYPAWQYQKHSRLRDLICQVYRDITGREMVVQAIHAGVECGLLMEKMPGLDAVSIGPDMKDVHTPSERLNIASTARTYELLKQVLEAVNG